MSAVCPSCGAGTHFDGAAWTRCGACRAMVFAHVAGPAVVVAHESERIAARVGVVVTDLGLHALHAPTGPATWRLVEMKRPVAAVLDVALPEVMSFQIIERMRAHPDLASIKVILIASVFNRTAYKRRPSSLYGADDYIEQHHVHDLLPQKLCDLLRLSSVSPHAHPPAIVGPDVRNDLIGSERVRALARSIAADVALYHAAEMARAMRGEASAVLDRALDEGRGLLVDMVGAKALSAGDPVREAFRTLVTDMRGGRP